MAVIKIPSKNIYEMQNEKIIDNEINKIEVKAKTVVPDNHYDESVYNESFNNFTSTSRIDSDFQSDVGAVWQDHYGYSGLAYVEANEYRYFYKDIKIPVQNNMHKITNLQLGVDSENVANIKFSLHGKENTTPISAVWDTKYTVIKESPIRKGLSMTQTKREIVLGQTSSQEKILEFPKEVTATQFIQGTSAGKDLKATINIDNQTNLAEITSATIKTIDGEQFFSIHAKILVGLKTITLTGKNEFPIELSDDVGTIYNSTINSTGTQIEYAPTQLEITIYGNTIGIDLKDETITVGDGKNTMSFTGNELMQTTNNPTLKSQYQTLLSEWKNGKETATLRCGISDYYDTDGNKAISMSKENGLPMTFHIGDIVQPYVFGADGKDRPMSTNDDGSPKVFEVVSKRVIYSGAAWQEIVLQETQKNT